MPIRSTANKNAFRYASCARGFTLIEVLVVVGIVSLLMALLLPAVQQTREAARRAACKNNLKQIGLALHNYHATHRTFPPGYIQSDLSDPAVHWGFAWGAMLLPYLDQGPLYDQLRPQFVAAPPTFSRAPLAVWVCPSDEQLEGYVGWRRVLAVYEFGTCTDSGGGTSILMQPACPVPPNLSWVGIGTFDSINGSTAFAARGSYVGNYGQRRLTATVGDGLFHGNSRVRLADVIDGASNTFLAGERYTALGRSVWEGVHYSETVDPATGAIVLGNANGKFVLGSSDAGNPNTGNGGVGFSSNHEGGCHMLLCDGAVRFVSENINNVTWNRLASRKDRQVLGEW